MEVRTHGPIDDPGAPVHLPRLTDVDPAAEKRMERIISGAFVLATLLAVGFCFAYFMIDEDDTFLGWPAMNFALGATLGGSMLLIGLGIIQWARKLMGDHEMTEERHPAASPADEVGPTLAALNEGLEDAGIHRRPLIRNSLLGAVAALGLPGVVMLRDLGPLPKGQDHTVFGLRKTMRVVNDVTGTPIKPSDIEVGQLINAEPGILFEVGADGEKVMSGAAAIEAKGKAAVIVVRMRPEDITPNQGRENWGVDGILCFSKICTHVGCPISLWEQQTHHLLCPCHQSTFDLAHGGKVIFGPAHRPLPQLKLDVDDEGYLIAVGDFEDIVGPSYPELAGDQAKKDKA
jgi:ubiquinol-cytochrome c reductase iron-sulfur subunit